ncbi:MAG TPA: PilZ domain-containing protein [Planctomycetota bacterium]|nr:PilZ domain-containing protein [Planctomycetota bacterium]
MSAEHLSSNTIAEKVLLFVRTDDGVSATGGVSVLCAEHVEARFDRATTPLLPLGTQALITFAGGGLNRRFGTRAFLESREEHAADRTYAFAPLDRDHYVTRFVEPFHRGVLRRAALRVKPDAAWAAAVEIRVGDGEPFVKGELVDLSVGGASVRMPKAAAAPFAIADRVNVRIVFPDGRAPLTAQAEVRRARLKYEHVTLGLKFDFPSPAAASVADRAVTAYIMEMQRRQLEGRVGRGWRPPTM